MTVPAPPNGLADATNALLSETAWDGVPPDLFSEVTPIESLTDVEAAAVDGGSSLLLDQGSFGLVAIRAGWTHRGTGDGFEDHVPISHVRLVRRAHAARTWSEVLREHSWGLEAEAPVLRGASGMRSWAEAERTLAEYDASLRALRGLAPDALLLLDGALDEDGGAPALREALLRRARQQGVRVVALAKDSGLSLTGTLPFTLELEERARRDRWPPRFHVDVTRALGREGTDVRTFAVRFDPRGAVYRADAACAAPADAVPLFSAVARLCNDPAYPGYPYPLARIHDRVRYADAEAGDLRRYLEARVSERRGALLGMRLFGRGRDVLALGG